MLNHRKWYWKRPENAPVNNGEGAPGWYEKFKPDQHIDGENFGPLPEHGGEEAAKDDEKKDEDKDEKKDEGKDEKKDEEKEEEPKEAAKA